MSAILHLRGSIHGEDYTLVGPLIDGSNALFEAKRGGHPEPCVVRLFPEIRAGSEVAHRIESAARLALTLHHTGVARVVDFNVRELPVFIGTDRVGGRSLERVLAEDGLFPFASAVRLVAQLAETLRAAHALGVVHGDLHPGGIHLIEESGAGVETCVLGFGWAREVRAASGDHRYAMYRAPEQRNGSTQRAVDPSVDQFALGAIAYEMLAGCSYISEESSDLADPEASRSRQPPRVAEMVLGLPAAVDEVLRRALSYDAGKRFPSVQAFAGALREVADVHGRVEFRSGDTPTEGLIPALPIGIRKPTLSTRTRMVFLAVGAAIVTVAVGLMASSLHTNVGVAPATATSTATATSPEQPQTPKIEVPNPTPPAPATDPQTPSPTAQAMIPPTAQRPAGQLAQAPSVVSKVRSHQKRHLRAHSRHGASRVSPGRRPHTL